MTAAAASLLPAAHGLPDGFIAEVVSTAKAITGRFAPNPRNDGKPMLLVVSKEGEVHVLEDPDSGNDGARKILDLSDSMCTNGERGLQSLAVHPQFGAADGDKRWVYLYYNKLRDGCLEDAEDGPRNVLVRYTMNADTLDLEDEEVLLTGAPMEESMHNGGAMLFGQDGYLYLTMGDAGVRANAQDRRNLHGSLLRLNDDGSVPEGNPFVGDGNGEGGDGPGVPCGGSDGRVPSGESDDAVCSEIFSYGFRNPFRMAADNTAPADGDGDASQTARFTISDVGGQHWEEISRGGSEYGGMNYGWPTYEGPCEVGSLEECAAADDGNFVEPFHYYEHKSIDEGGCVAGAAFVPTSLWPSEYRYLFIDFIFLKIYNLIEDPDGECRQCSPPVSAYRNETFYESVQEDGENVNEARMTDLFFGPYEDTQALYVIKFGNHDSIIRIRYTGTFNKPPVPQFAVENADHQDQQILVGHVVTFNGTQSSDPEGGAVTFSWDFGDGNTSAEVSPTHSFGEPGEYRVKLVVTDTEDQAQETSETVVVGQPPNATILSPAPGDEFFVGQVLKLNGEAFDYMGNRIADDQLRWEVRKHHADHYHPFVDEKSGNDFDLYPAPGPEDFYAATNSFLWIYLFATDANGLTTETSRVVQPRIVLVDVETEPQGLVVVVHDYPVETPNRITSWVGFNMPLSVEDQPPFVFQSWSDGNTNRSRFMQLLNETAETMVRANFCLDYNTTCAEAPERCCTGYCSVEGLCLDAPTTPNGTLPEDGDDSDIPPLDGETTEEADEGGDNDFVVPVDDPLDDTVVPVEIPPDDNVGGDSVDYASNVTSPGDQNTTADDGSGIVTAGKWLLSICVLLIWAIVCLLALRYRKRRQENDAAATHYFNESPTKVRPSLASIFATPRNAIKTSASSPETCLSASMTELSPGSIWERLAEENDRRARLRARWSQTNDNSTAETSTPGVTVDPRAAAESPISVYSSPTLQGSIDDAFARLDDLLERAFSSRQRRSRADAAPTETAPPAEADPSRSDAGAHHNDEAPPMYDVEANTPRSLDGATGDEAVGRQFITHDAELRASPLDIGGTLSFDDDGLVDASMLSSPGPLPPHDVTLGSLPDPPPQDDGLPKEHDEETALFGSADVGSTSGEESDDVVYLSVHDAPLEDVSTLDLRAQEWLPPTQDGGGTMGLIDTSDYLSMEFGMMTSFIDADNSSVHSSEFSN